MSGSCSEQVLMVQNVAAAQTSEATVPIVDVLFSLEEPWRERFLTLIAGAIARGQRNGDVPTRTEVAFWLQNDPSLEQLVIKLLEAWIR